MSFYACHFDYTANRLTISIQTLSKCWRNHPCWRRYFRRSSKRGCDHDQGMVISTNDIAKLWIFLGTHIILARPSQYLRYCPTIYKQNFTKKNQTNVRLSILWGTNPLPNSWWWIWNFLPAVTLLFLLQGATPKWTDEQCIQILKNCHGSLKEEGKVIIIDVIMPEIPGSTDGDKYVSVLDAMFLQSGAKQRTVQEFENLGKCAGFSRSQVAASIFASALGVIELYK